MMVDDKKGTLLVRFGSFPVPGADTEASIPIDVINGRMETVSLPDSLLYFGRPASFDLPTGPYLVRVTLPSGELLTEEVDVEAGVNRELTVAGELTSPHKWMTVPSVLARPASRSTTGFAFDDVSRMESLRRPMIRTHVWASLRLLRSKRKTAEWLPQEGISPAIDWPKVDDDFAFAADPLDVLKVQEITLPSPLTLPGRDALPGTPLVQYWLSITGPDPIARFAALPIPREKSRVRVLIIFDPQDVEQAPAAVLEPQIGRLPRGRDPVRLTISSGNPAADVLLGYLAQGMGEAARRVGRPFARDAEAMLQHSGIDPVGATVGAYFLLQSGDLARLHDWTNNLANWFPWLPDGPVIHAWHLMRQGPRDKVAEQVRDRLLEAESRGLPIFTRGTRLLYDGLDLLVNLQPNDAPIRAARDRVQCYARALDGRAPTTTFYGLAPDNPVLPHGFIL
jgi:hypothetical protein